VLPAGAADGDGKIAAVVGHQTRQPALHEFAYVTEHILCIRGFFQKPNHCGVAPGERAQLRAVMRIGQAAHIENQIGIQRDAALERE
jgi:hypothetical protein